MFVSVSTAPRAAPSPTRPHKTWTFLGSPDCNTPPPEELLENFLLDESCLVDPFADEACFEDLESGELASLEDSDSDLDEYDFWLSDPPTPTPSPPSDDLYFDDAELFSDSACPSPTTTTNPTVAVLGLNPAGIRTATLFASAPAASCHVLAYDASSPLVARVAAAHATSHPTITFTSSARLLASATHFLVCGVTAASAPAALRTVAAHARPGATVVLESAAGLAVGATRALLASLARRRLLLGGASPGSSYQDRDVCCSPKIVAGLCAASLASVHALYARAHPALLTVATPEDAEREALRRAAERTPDAVVDAAMRSLLSSSRRRANVLVVGGMGGPAAASGGGSGSIMAPGCAAARRLVKTWGAAVVWADPAVAGAAVPWAPKLEEGGWSEEGLGAAFDLIVVAGRRPDWDFGVLERLKGDVKVRWCCE